MSARTPKILMLWPAGLSGVVPEHPLLKLQGKNRFQPPLTLCTLAGMLPQEWPVRIIDEQIEAVPDEAIAWADVVFLSGLFPQREHMLRLAGRARAMNKRVVAGGPDVTAAIESTRGHGLIDSFCLHEAEPYFADLVRDIQADELKPIYGEKLVLPDLALSPVPRFDLLKDFDKYIMPYIQTSRGCPFDCEFCDVPSMYGRKVRTKSAAQVIREIEAVHRFRADGQLCIWDDNFVGKVSAAKETLVAITQWQKEHGYPFEIMAEVSVHLADDPELLDAFYAANVRYVTMGIESPNPDSLKEANKRNNLRGDLLSRIHRIIEAGIEPSGHFIVGFDSDPPGIFEAQRSFISDAMMVLVDINVLQAIEGTRLHRRMDEEKRLRWGAESERGARLYWFGITNFDTRMDPGELQRGFADLLAGLYEPAAMYERVRRMVERLPERDRHQWNMTLEPTAESLSLVALMLASLPGRRAMLREAWKLRKHGQWRVFRYFQSALAAGLQAEFYRQRVSGIRANPYEAVA